MIFCVACDGFPREIRDRYFEAGRAARCRTGSNTLPARGPRGLVLGVGMHLSRGAARLGETRRDDLSPRRRRKSSPSASPGPSPPRPGCRGACGAHPLLWLPRRQAASSPRRCGSPRPGRLPAHEGVAETAERDPNNPRARPKGWPSRGGSGGRRPGGGAAQQCRGGGGRSQVGPVAGPAATRRAPCGG